MLTAVEGYVKNGQMVIKDNISLYEGHDFIVTFLKTKRQEAKTVEKELDLDKYTRRTKWGQQVEEYMEEMRGNDRL
ncbi:MAG: hypothetical protein NC417_13230 [Candidatus Gastranaerophilales bacterium]|nr:hypothetical protein [Candidatus Gastranaerophilales bacterium]